MLNFTFVPMATTLRVSRTCRSFWGLVVAAAVAGWLAPVASAAEKAEESASRIVAKSGESVMPPAEIGLPSQMAAGCGNTFCNGIRLQDEIVVANVRQVCTCCDPAVLRDQIKFENYVVCDEAGTRRWEPSDLESFLSFDPSVPTVIFVHGNQVSPWDAKCQGVAVYRRLIVHADDAQRIRYVIYSWPSSQIGGGLLYDIRVKAARTGPAGCQLAWLIDQLPTETPVSLAGFSFGARIITGGLHVLAGGNLGGCGFLAERLHPERQPMSVILMASALHAHWLGDGQYHGLAMTQVSQMFLINNCEDLAMKYYDFIEPGCGGPQALGLCGPTRISAENARKIRMRDVSRWVGTEHDLMRYVCAPGDAALIWQYTGGAAYAEAVGQ
jgi:hypothetical protein